MFTFNISLTNNRGKQPVFEDSLSSFLRENGANYGSSCLFFLFARTSAGFLRYFGKVFDVRR